MVAVFRPHCQGPVTPQAWRRSRRGARATSIHPAFFALDRRPNSCNTADHGLLLVKPQLQPRRHFQAVRSLLDYHLRGELPVGAAGPQRRPQSQPPGACRMEEGQCPKGASPVGCPAGHHQGRPTAARKPRYGCPTGVERDRAPRPRGGHALVGRGKCTRRGRPSDSRRRCDFALRRAERRSAPLG